MKKFLKDLGASLLMAVIALLILAEWMAGCGESYVDSVGKRHYYECLVIPYEPPEESDEENDDE